jgi:UDP-2,4-diacetamido-2,4,6-trideoxy-beta-L-altropyranose hydrolase/UDP-4-amino-4,6-dideoxy-N-acetyl-beta-L-altrosamine N-acetyltransferase
MRVVFRVDSSLEIGTGHVMRCLALAETLRSNGASIDFISRNHKGNLIKKIISKGFNVLKLDNSSTKAPVNGFNQSHWLGSTQEQDALDCLSMLESTQIDWLIVDHYGINEKWEKLLKSTYKNLLVIDDLADRKHQCNILIDQTFGRVKKDYKDLVNGSCEILCGPEYALLRPEFHEWRKFSLERRNSSNINRILISMGGFDFDNITEKVLETLYDHPLLFKLKIVVVLNADAPHIESVRLKASSLPYSIEVKTNADNMAEIMANSDIAIGASGISTWERCSLGLPSIQFITADNQKFVAKLLSKKNAIRLITDISEINDLLLSAPRWMNDLSVKSSKICNGMGVDNVYEKITHLFINIEGIGNIKLKNYTNLNSEEKLLVLDMRNHKNIRKFMHFKDIISLKSHQEFIDGLKVNSDKLYFLVKKNNKIVGSINILRNKLDNSVVFGLYKNPFDNIKNAGKILLDVILHYSSKKLGVNTVSLEVLSNNSRAVNFYSKYGFQINKIIQVDGKDILCMKKKLLTKNINEK